jgi:hypothetical protein
MKSAWVRNLFGGCLLVMTSLGAKDPPAPVLLGHPASMNPQEKHGGFERVQVNRACEGCHVEIAAEWRESRHQMAYTNGPFQRSLKREAATLQPFCQSCHAPESNPFTKPSDPIAGLGVGCVTCHAPLGPILAANGSGQTPHPVLRTHELSTDAACAQCHQFAFPGAAGRAGLLMQRTLDEHASNQNEKTCLDCHMPVDTKGKPHKSHRFPGGYDESLVKSALEIRVSREKQGTIHVALTPKNITHAMPTGDLFRRLAIEAIPDDPSQKAATIYLARHFRRGREMHESGDDRVFQDERLVDLNSPPGPVTVRVRYERVGHHRSPDEHDADIESSVLLGEWPLP